MKGDMRICKLLDDDLAKKHGKYAEVLGLSDTPTGMKARLRFGDQHREQVPVQHVRMLQDYDLAKIVKDPRKRKELFN
ncbi:uncharacterized protein METZ01_LOCUS361243 [marine metagenome]|uniref:Uncharacterized protein n=1 Tax=marine metagenome TaxID=408172 RepID=A0A382SEV1_9ZZZZ|tara:strand:- start:272 stop:505 length:234 start_codon:yes stop_codon:yes gene_type:complete